MAGQVVWYFHLLKNFPQFILIHTGKAFGIVNKAELDVFLELFWFFKDPTDVGNLISGSSAFFKTSLNIWKFTVRILLKSGLENMVSSEVSKGHEECFYYSALEDRVESDCEIKVDFWVSEKI